MSRQRLFPFDDDGICQNNTSPRYYSSTKKQFSGFPSPKGDYKTITLDRKSVKSLEKMPNLFGTLPRQQLPSSSLDLRTKIKAIGAFTNMYLATREAKDEELSYLEAVESGDLNMVEEILEKHKNIEITEEEDEEENDESESDAEETPSVRIIENGVQSEPPEARKKNRHESSPKRVSSDNDRDSNASIFKENTIHVEMVELNDQQPNDQPPEVRPPIGAARKRRLTHRRLSGVGNMWQNKGANLAAPLPVSFANKQTSFYHKRKNTLDVEDIDPTASKRKIKFNKNCKDQWGRSALFIAIIHQNLDMLELLLSYKVKSEECLYHAIDFGYYDIVELFMEHTKNVTQMIKRNDSFYPPGLTPFQLAAHKNDYVMLRILHSNGYDITTESKQRAFSKKSRNYQANVDQHSTVLDRAWDSSNHQLLYYRAISSPAYLVMTFTEGVERNSASWDFLDTIFDLYAELKKKISKEPTVRSLYSPLADQVEDFACDLLSEVRSSSDLASLLRFDPPGQEQQLTNKRNHLTPVQRAIEVRMKRFVAHEHSQLAISTMRLGTLFEKEHGWRTSTTRFFLALAFPILCIVFNIWPDSKFGSLLRNPMVNMSCHIISEISFLFLMIMRLVLLTMVYECDCLGTSLYPIDYVILLWIIARFFNQVKKFREVTCLELLKNAWALNDLATLLLFVIVIILKIYDMASYHVLGPNVCPATISNVTEFMIVHNIPNLEWQCTRSEWRAAETWPVTISEAALAIIYLLIHIRAMELLYTDRTFGPLQLSLDKMLLDTIRFLCIFFVTFLAFAFAMTQLFWAWGRPRSRQLNLNDDYQLCEQGADYSSDACYPVYSFIYHSLLEQYWTLYGYGWGEEPPAATKIPTLMQNSTDYEGVTVIAGQAVSMIFHAWAVVVMLNMLVAMMSHSFERVRNNAELEWKFHRSVMWMKFINKGIYPRPLPMNLIPSTRDLKSAFNYLRSKLPSSWRGSYAPNPEPHQEKTLKENKKYREALKHIVHRYMRRYLLPDFRHDEIDQPVNRGNPGLTRRPSSMGDDIGIKNFVSRSSDV